MTEILKEYKKVFEKHKNDIIIDTDNYLKQKFTLQIHRLENFVKELNGIIPPNRQSNYFIILVKKGNGQKSIGHFSFPINDSSIEIKEGQRRIHGNKDEEEERGQDQIVGREDRKHENIR